MSSIPYFYIIQNIHNKLYYAGAKWGKDADPLNFMTENGYKTSSKVVKSLIEEYGLQTFIIRKIKIFETKEKAYEYEKRFLKKVNARKNDKFLNLHNNDGPIDIIFLKNNYGVENVFQLPEIIKKSRITNLEKYGVEYYTQTSEYRKRYEETCIEKYNVTHYSKTDDFKEKHKETCIEKYGVDNYSKTDDFKEKHKETCIEKYGVDNYSKTDEFKEKFETYSMEKYNTKNPFQAEEVKDKIKNTNLLKYGTEYYSQSEEGKKKISEKAKEIGVGKWNKGKQKTEITKEKMSKSALGRERIICEKCGNGFTKPNFNKHFNSCKEKNKPYNDVIIEKHKRIRTFTTLDVDEFVWHRDLEDRTIKLLEGEGWLFQFDNELPFYINKNETIFIQKMKYHRIIPSDNKLILEINEII